ncbi:cyclic nucleotide-binding domain-containing protein [Caenimonas sedimenti]|uniref:cyclic nucleotide-binding domain-containing protein n=1 Tax=Caenimonas sedimenti TaxID=2596921 RepID=UPI001648D4A9|nr:cyclic nucleotide-binding domain-containing protein [Caenimonas sedimenti]
MSTGRLSILVEEDVDLPLPKAAGGALTGGLLALGTILPQTLALVAIAYAPLLLVGLPLNPLWCLWSAIAGITIMFILARGGGAIFGVRPGAALLYASTLTTCIGLAPSLKLQAAGVMALAAACMTVAGIVIWLSVRTGATAFARYLPAPVGRGLSLGFGLTILWIQVKTLGGWFINAKGGFQYPIAAIAAAFLVLVLLAVALPWRKKHPNKPYLLLLLPVAAAVVWGIEYVTSIPFGWIAAPAVKAPMDLLPLWLPQNLGGAVPQVDHLQALLPVITVLIGQALFVAFTFMVDAAGNAAALENLTGDAYDLNGELRASAITMITLPWFGLVPASSMIAATRPLYDNGIKNAQAIWLGNLVVIAGLLGLVGLVWLGLNRLPLVYVVAALVIIGLNLLEPSLFERPGRSQGERQMWWQTWLIGLVFALSSGIFAMLAGFAVAVGQLVKGVEGTIIRSTYTLKDIRSRRWRNEEEDALIRRSGERCVVIALQGTASFAVARRIREEISRLVNPKNMDVLLVDAHRVTHWDLTALEAFKRMADEFQRTHVEFMLSHPTADVRKMLSETIMMFSNTDKALEWAENEILRRQGIAPALQNKPYSRVDALPLVAEMSDEGRRLLSSHGKVITVAAGMPVFNAGDNDGSLLVVLAGNVSIEVPAAPGSEALRVASFGTGMVFGEMAFLDGTPRSGKATATSSCQLFLLSRNNFATWAQQYPHDAQLLLNNIAKQLSHRLRFTTGQLIAVNA